MDITLATIDVYILIEESFTTHAIKPGAITMVAQTYIVNLNAIKDITNLIMGVVAIVIKVEKASDKKLVIQYRFNSESRFKIYVSFYLDIREGFTIPTVS